MPAHIPLFVEGYRTMTRWFAAVALLAVLGVVGTAEDKNEEKKPEAPPPLRLPIAPGMNEDTIRRLEEMNKRLEKLFKERLGPGGLLLPRGAFDLPGVRSRNRPQPRLGAQVRSPSPTLIDQLDLPKDQGIVLEEVGPNSAAARSGMKPHDILLELDGKPVSSKVDDFLKQLAAVKAGQKVEAVVMRKGKKETLKDLTLPEVKAEARPARPVPGILFPNLGGALGGRGDGTSLSVMRNNDDFTVKEVRGKLTVIVTGTATATGPKISEVVVDRDGKKETFNALEKVPDDLKARVKDLAEMGAGKKAKVDF